MRLGVLYLGRMGGIAHYTAHLVRALAPMAEVTVYLSSYNETLGLYQGVRAVRHLTPTYRGAAGLLRSLLRPTGPRRLARRMAADDLDVLLDTGAGPWAELVKRELPASVHLADVVHDPRPHEERMALPSRVLRRLQPRRAHTLIGLSRYSSELLRRDHPDRRHVASWHGPILPVERADPSDAASHSQRLLFFGRIEPYKGLSVLVDALALARARRPGLSLSVLGRGRIPRRTRRVMAELGVQVDNRWVSDADLARAIDAHGLVVAPYLSATQSGVVAAAMARGRPVIVTRVGGLPEQVEPGRTGWVVPRSDAPALAGAIVAASSDPAGLAELGARGLEQARTTWAWPSIARRLLDDLEAARGQDLGRSHVT